MRGAYARIYASTAAHVPLTIFWERITGNQAGTARGALPRCEEAEVLGPRDERFVRDLGAARTLRVRVEVWRPHSPRVTAEASWVTVRYDTLFWFDQPGSALAGPWTIAVRTGTGAWPRPRRRLGLAMDADAFRSHWRSWSRCRRS